QLNMRMRFRRQPSRSLSRCRLFHDHTLFAMDAFRWLDRRITADLFRPRCVLDAQLDVPRDGRPRAADRAALAVAWPAGTNHRRCDARNRWSLVTSADVSAIDPRNEE